jgi:hypothetical protein
MARADATPGVRDDPACARCHTTAGFLDAIGVRPAQRSARTSEEESIAETSAERGRRGDRVPPPDVGLAGIACAACHAAHGEDVGRALVRRVRRPELLVSAAVLDAAPVTGICLPCHTPDDGDAPPQASAAALWLGRGGSRIAGGEPLDGEAPHASVADGCIGCHAAPRPGLEVERGAGHAFGVDRAACARCHATEPSERAARGASIEGRARRVAEELAARGLLPAPGAFPAHASARANDTALLDPAAARAVRNALLVLEDPAAAEHNAPYARALLDEVERWLATP